MVSTSTDLGNDVVHRAARHDELLFRMRGSGRHTGSARDEVLFRLEARRSALSIGRRSGRIALSIGGRCCRGRASIDWRDGATADDLRRGARPRGWRRRRCRARSPGRAASTPRPPRGSSGRRRASATARARCPASSRAGTRTLALVVTDITNPFYGDIIRGAHEAAGELGYTLLLSHTQEDAQLEREWTERELRAVEGVLLDELADVGPGDPDDGQAEAGHRPQPPAPRGAEHPRRQRPRRPAGRRAPDRARPRLDHLRRRPRVELDRRDALAGAARGGLRARPPPAPGRPVQQPDGAGRLRRAGEIAAQRATAVIAYNDVVAIGVLKGLLRLGAARPRRRQRHRLRQHAARRDRRARADHGGGAAARHGAHRRQEPRRHGRRRACRAGSRSSCRCGSSSVARPLSAAGRGPRRRSGTTNVPGVGLEGGHVDGGGSR